MIHFLSYNINIFTLYIMLCEDFRFQEILKLSMTEFTFPGNEILGEYRKSKWCLKSIWNSGSSSCTSNSHTLLPLQTRNIMMITLMCMGLWTKWLYRYFYSICIFVISLFSNVVSLLLYSKNPLHWNLMHGQHVIIITIDRSKKNTRMNFKQGGQKDRTSIYSNCPQHRTDNLLV